METRNETYNENGGIDCEINHPVHGWIPTTLDLSDTETSEFFADVQANKAVAAFVPVVPTQAELDTIRKNEIQTRLTQIDSESIRPLRAIATGSAVQFDTDKLTALNAERATLAAELVVLNG